MAKEFATRLVSSPLGGGDTVLFVQYGLGQEGFVSVTLAGQDLTGATLGVEVSSYLFDFDSRGRFVSALAVDTPAGVTLGEVTAELSDAMEGEFTVDIPSDLYVGPTPVEPYGVLLKVSVTYPNSDVDIVPVLVAVSDFEGSVAGSGGGVVGNVFTKAQVDSLIASYLRANPPSGVGGGLVRAVSSQFDVVSGRLSLASDSVGVDEIGDGAVTEGALDNLLRDTLEGSADASSLSVSGHVLSLDDNEGNTSSVTLPSSGGGGGGGLTQGEVDARIAARVKGYAVVGGPGVQPSVDMVEASSVVEAAGIGVDDGVLLWDEGDSVYKLASVPQLRDVVRVDEDVASNPLSYSTTGTYQLTSGHAAGVTHDTGVELAHGDMLLTLSASGLSGVAQVDVIELLGKPEVAAGVNAVVTGVTGNGVSVMLQSRQFWVFHSGGKVVLADGQVADSRLFTINRLGWRLEEFADKRAATTRVPKSRLPVDVVYGSGGDDNHEAASRAEAEAGSEVGLRSWSPLRVGQAAVARINALIPSSRRVPAYAVGDANEVLRVNATGTGLEFSPAGGGESNPAAASESEAEGGVEAGLRSWSPLRVAQGALARIGGAFKVGVLRGASREKVQDIVDSFAGGGGWGDSGARVGGSSSSAQYDAAGIAGVTYGATRSVGTREQNVYVPVRVAEQGALSVGRYRLAVVVDDENDEFNYYYVLGGGDVVRVSHAGGFFYYSVLVADVPAGSVLKVEENEQWELNPDFVTVPKAFAAGMALEQGEAIDESSTVKGTVSGKDIHDAVVEAVPTTVSVELERKSPGLTLATTMANQRPAAPSYFSPVFDLDASGQGSGEFHFELTLDIAPVSDVNMSFEEGSSNATSEQRTTTLSAIVFASDLSGVGDFVFSSTESLAGVQAFEVPVWSLSTRVGTYFLLLVHNANNEVGVYHYWDGRAGGTGAVLSAALRGAFHPSDAVSEELTDASVLDLAKAYED